ncbi:antitoxin CptB [Meinhardsimonia xiamenensis]|jgi:antitoxin CptB|uniref:FAD assembly factor SdhE n=2 Tax=Meinhardsimonia xiamenensis TaxID=990712 RepID=A0A1G9FLF4_9RHOB|nr:antitoxin CptB [Meinhardsimonia xiamenensis]SDK89013.1 antitoxin CptB [Meinhardsimonia xiamenensis]
MGEAGIGETRKVQAMTEGAETREIRLKRLRLRSWRRGTKEMDLILGHFADRALEAMSTDELDLYEALLDEADQDLAGWAMGREAPPARFAGLMAQIMAHSGPRR